MAYHIKQPDEFGMIVSVLYLRTAIRVTDSVWSPMAAVYTPITMQQTRSTTKNEKMTSMVAR